MYFIKFEKFSAIIYSKLFSTVLFLLSFWSSDDMNGRLLVLQIFELLFIFPLCLYWIISIDISYSSVTLFSVIFIVIESIQWFVAVVYFIFLFPDCSLLEQFYKSEFKIFAHNFNICLISVFVSVNYLFSCVLRFFWFFICLVILVVFWTFLILCYETLNLI